MFKDFFSFGQKPTSFIGVYQKNRPLVVICLGFFLFVLVIVVRTFAGPGEHAEISEYTYARLESMIDVNPELRPLVLSAYSDRVITFAEYNALKEVHQGMLDAKKTKP